MNGIKQTKDKICYFCAPAKKPSALKLWRSKKAKAEEGSDGFGGRELLR
jgi:hypothetical protein